MAEKLSIKNVENSKCVAVGIGEFSFNVMESTTNTVPTALIIDDEVDICYLLKRILSFKSIKADYVTSLEDARNYLRNNVAPLIFLDNHLKDGLGINFINEIKKINPHSKVVMITAYDTFGDREDAYRQGVDFFLGKPFSKEIILNTLEKLKV